MHKLIITLFSKIKERGTYYSMEVPTEGLQDFRLVTSKQILCRFADSSNSSIGSPEIQCFEGSTSEDLRELREGISSTSTRGRFFSIGEDGMFNFTPERYLQFKLIVPKDLDNEIGISEIRLLCHQWR